MTVNLAGPAASYAQNSLERHCQRLVEYQNAQDKEKGGHAAT